MKVFEILRNDIAPVTEQQIVDRLKKFNWKYEFSENTDVVKRGARELELIENMVYRLWKTNPDRAVQLWSEHAPGFKDKSTLVPSFIIRLQLQDVA